MTPEKRIERLRTLYLAVMVELTEALNAACPGLHTPRQHRDGKPPCPECGRGRDGVQYRDVGGRAVTHRPMDADELEARHAELQKLKQRLEVEIVAVQDGLRMHGRWGRAGRPRKAPTHTEAEALEAHNRYQAGDRTPWAIAGHRQYQREERRRAYAASKLDGST